MPGPERNVWTTVVAANPGHARAYAQRWRDLEATGRDVDGEARLIDAMAARGSRILDAGCGTGRVGGYLAARGHDVVGVDLDEHLVSVAREDHPGSRWEVGDLATFALHDAAGAPLAVDLVVSAGNVVTFLAGSERVPALERIRAHLAAGGRAVIGFQTARGYSAEEFAADVEQAGLTISQRFASWQLAPWTEDAGFLVAVLVAD